MKNKKVLYLSQGAMIAALYVVLVIVFRPIGSDAIQVRIAEAMTILPIFTPAAIPGLTVGCLLGNLLTGSVLLDVIFGPFATFVGALGTYLLRKRKVLSVLPPILANALIVPWILRFAYGDKLPIWLMMITVGAGEVIACGGIGTVLRYMLYKSKKTFE